jgi:hypothetical protein
MTDADFRSAGSIFAEIVNRANGRFLGVYGNLRDHPATLFTPAWQIAYRNWEFIPTQGGCYIIKLVDNGQCLTRTPNQHGARDWNRYSNPMVALAASGGAEQEWIIKPAAELDPDSRDSSTHLVTIHPRLHPEEVFASYLDVGKTDGPAPYEDGWSSTALQPPQGTPAELWQVPLGVLPARSAFSVSPGERKTLKRDGKPGYPGVQLEALDEGKVPPQTVRVTLPSGMGMRFVNTDLIVGVMRGDTWVPTTYPGHLSEDGLTLTVHHVDPELSGRGSKSTALVSVAASSHTHPGDSSLRFQVGDQHSFAPVHVAP